MPESSKSIKFISVRALAQDERIFINGKPRHHLGLLALLRRRFKLTPTMVRIPGLHKGMLVAAITEKEAEAVVKSLTSVEVEEKERTL